MLTESPLPGSDHEEPDVPDRWSAERKGEVVLRLMRQHALRAPRRHGPPTGNPGRDGTITPERPDVMWGTDATCFCTEQDGWCWFFGAID